MKIPSCVLWKLTKKWNSYLVKTNGQQFTRDPLSLTNLHNATSSGISNDGAIGLQARKEKGKKGFKKVVTLLQKHKSHNKISKKKKNTTSGLLYSKNELRRGFRRIGKVVKGLPNISEKNRKIALRRL